VDDRWLFPVLVGYAESDVLPDGLPVSMDWHDPELAGIRERGGWTVWPLIPYRHDTVVRDIGRPSPGAALRAQLARHRRPARDVLARVIYGFRISSCSASA
jgi:microcin C transport system permease protein